jgi:hypothetical protein
MRFRARHRRKFFLWLHGFGNVFDVTLTPGEENDCIFTPDKRHRDATSALIKFPPSLCFGAASWSDQSAVIGD